MRSLITRKNGFIAVIIVVLAFFLTACEDPPADPKSQSNEQKKVLDNYSTVIEKQPVPLMPYSPTRNTIAEWAKYWQVPGRLAYTYITDGPNDFKGGYYVFIGPPVSNCTGMTNPLQKVKVDLGEYDGQTYIPKPGIDSVYGGGDCTEHYGIDAVTKLPVAFSVGMGQNMQYFAQPNQRYDSSPLGTATLETAKKGG